MKGILLVSHGDMAKGMHHSAGLFMGENIEVFDYLSLQAEDSPETFKTMLDEKVQALDEGQGVLIFADLLGGTPCNQALKSMNEKVDLIAGVNFTVLLEVLSKRQFTDEIDMDELVSIGQDGLVNVKQLLASMQNEE